jgi:murein DD-endopeptidase MepM/ murein hydrolase activator NlpD
MITLRAFRRLEVAAYQHTCFGQCWQMSLDRRNLMAQTRAKLSSLLQERQLIMRTSGETRLLTLSVNVQWGLIVLAACMLAVIAVLSFSFVHHADRLAAEQKLTQKVQADHKQLLDHLDRYKASVATATNEIRETESQLRRIFGQNETLRQTLMSKESALEVSQKQRDHAQLSSLELGQQLNSLGRDLKQISAKNEGLEGHINSLRSALAVSKSENDQMGAAYTALDRRIWQLHNDLKGSKTRNIYLKGHVKNLKGDLDQVKADLRQVLRDRQSIRAENKTLSDHVAELNETLKGLESEHSNRLEAIYARAHERSNLLEKVIRRTGIDMVDLLPIPEGMLRGQGGPFIPLHPDFEGDELEDDQPILEKIRTAAGRWQQIEDVFLSMPLAVPVKHYYVASRFGRRRDPFNGRWARHEGLDLAGPIKQPVFATANGRVTHAGWLAKYGKLVEIDHGNDIVTRFGHLHKITVKKGDQVTIGDSIALLGNTGRSTGPHVHYEVRYKGKPLDPWKFLRATRNVR